MLYVNNEAEQYFKDLEDNQELLHTRYHYICETLNHSLATQDYDKLLSLRTYIESPEGYLTFEHIAEVRRILRILNIISLEQKYSTYIFSSDCFNLEELMDKYFLTLFAFRRILFRLSDRSLEEATQYLSNNIISHFATYILSTEELLIPTQVFFETLLEINAPYWSSTDIKQFLLMIQQTT